MSEPLTGGKAVALSDKPHKSVFGHLYEATKERMARDKEIASLESAVITAALAYREARKSQSDSYQSDLVAAMRSLLDATNALAEGMKK